MHPSIPGLSKKHAFLLLAILITCIWVPFQISGQSLLHRLSGISAAGFFSLFLLLACKWGFQLWRTQIMLRMHGLFLKSPKVLKMLWAYEFLSESTPGGIGAPVAAYALLRHYHLTRTHTIGLSIMAVTLDITAIIFLALLALGIALIHHDSNTSHAILPLILLLMILPLGLWVFLKKYRSLISITSRVLPDNLLGKKLTRTLTRAYLQLGHYGELIYQHPPSRVLALLLTSVGIWGCRLSVLFLTMIILGENTEWFRMFYIQLLSGLAGTLTGLPGGAIGAELTLAGLLMPRFDLTTTTAAILLWRLQGFYLPIMLGGIAFLTLALQYSFIMPASNHREASQKNPARGKTRSIKAGSKMPSK